MTPLKFMVTFKGEVAPDGNDPEAQDIAMTRGELDYALHQAIKHAVSNGLITGETPATLEDYSVDVYVEESK